MTNTLKKDFSITTFTEIKTATGQLISIQCRKEDIDKIKELSELIYHIEQPVTKELKNVCHGGYGRYTRFDIEQKNYAGGGSGYIECIKIHNPPENRNGNIIHSCESDTSKFWEFETIEEASEAWEHVWGSIHPEDKLKTALGFIREVKCGWYSPWFYAIANQALTGDFAFPNRIGLDHPIYRPFNKFKVSKEIWNTEKEEYENIYEVKTCIGYTETKVRYDYDREFINYTIYWDDGKNWCESSLKDAPELINKDAYKIVLKPKFTDFIQKEKYDI